MEIYHYHPQTREYLFASQADESPLEAGAYLIPKNSTEVQPPTATENTAIIFLDSGEWSLAPDYRGSTYWIGEEKFTISSIGEEIPDGASTAKPINIEIKKQILALEKLQTARRMREAALGIDDGWLSDINSQIVSLREQLT